MSLFIGLKEASRISSPALQSLISAIHFFNHLIINCGRLIKMWTPEDCQRVIPLVIMPNTRSGAPRTREGVNEQIDRRLAGALGAHDAARNLEPLIGDGGEQGEVNRNEGNRNGGNGNG
ncbi:hypothetical protein Tco_0889011 [Tanacetum coccineum]